MATNAIERTIREAGGVFHDAGTFQEAVDELLSTGFDRAELSLLAGEHAVTEKLGHMYEKVAAFEDDASIPRVAYVSPESIGDAEGALIGGLMYVGAGLALVPIVASGGALATAIIGTALAGGAGGLIGGVLARWVGKRHAHYLQEQLERGGLLLWVRVRDAAHEARAVEILRRHAGDDIHVHTLPVEVETGV